MVFNTSFVQKSSGNNIQGEDPLLHLQNLCLQKKPQTIDEDMIKGDAYCGQTSPDMQYDTKALPIGSIR